MTAPALFSGHFFSPLGWALFHFLWQGALVAGLLVAIRWIFRSKPPALRYALSCGALVTMLALPVATTWSLAKGAVRHSSSAGSPAAVLGSRGASLSAAAIGDAIRGADGFLPAAIQNRLEALRPWALAVWFAGVLLLSVRFLGGLSAARRLTRRGTRPAPCESQRMLARIAGRLSITRPVKLLESTIVRVPTAIGAFRPVILFPASVFTGLPGRGLEALIAHELAHVRRHDYLVNLLQTMTETLLFYHPAVWWVSARVRADREQCCDDLAIAATGDARTYARALMRLEEMRGGRPTLAVAAAGGNLWKRIVRLLTQAPASVERPSGWLAGAVAVGVLLLLGAAARVGSSAAWQDETDAGRGAPAETITPDVVVRASARSAGVAPSEPPDESSKPGPEEALAGEEGNFETDEPDDSGVDAPEEKATSDETKGRLLTVEELALFRTHGVTADDVRAIALLGYDRAQPGDILSLKIHGVTPEDIAEMNRIFGNQPLEQHVTFKIHGVTPDAVRKLSSLGLGTLSADDVVSMKIHGVDAEYVERLRAAGYPRMSADDVVSAKIHGVAPGDAAAWSRLGYAAPSLEDLVSLRIHGATPEFASEVRALGFSNLSLDDLVAFRIHGVTAGFLREMKSLDFGFPAFSSDDAVAFRIHGVTPEFVRGIRSLGYSDASPDDLVALRIHGISTEQIRKDNARAGRRLTLDEHVERRFSRKDRSDEN